MENNKTVLAPGQSVKLWIDAPVDYDSWTTSDGASGQELDDTLFGKWSGGGTDTNFSTMSGYETVWTAPKITGIYKITIIVNDDISRGSTNGRNDLLDDTHSVTLTVRNPTVSGLQWRNPSDSASTYQPVSGALQVLKGTRLIFKAISAPEGATWPSGSPTWTGADSTSGETVNFSAPTVSSSTSDFKTITAKAGTSTASASVLVYDFMPTTQAVVQFPGRNEMHYGVGEAFYLQYITQPAGVSVDIDWEIYSGLGTLKGTQFTAGNVDSDVTIRAWIKSGPSVGGYRDMSRSVVAPTGIKMSNYFDPEQIGHNVDSFSVGAKTKVSILPSDVSFDAIEVRELDAPATGTGAFAAYTNNPNWAHSATVDNNGNPSYNPIGLPRNATDGSLMDGGDKIAYGTAQTVLQPGVDPSGTFTWNIHWVYIMVFEFDKRERPLGTGTVDQVVTVTSNATANTVTVSKGGYSISANYSDTTVHPELTLPQLGAQ